MKALVVGYGSIGRRHARVLEAMGHAVAVVSRRADIGHPRRFSDLASALARFAPDHVVIATRTREHLNDVTAVAGSGFAGTVLVEKPLFEAAHPFPAHRFSGAYVAYQLRFHPVVLAVREHLAGRRCLAAHVYVGQYLPDWRPGTDYRVGYSASRAEGGGALRDLSHELDLVTWLLGGWSRLAALGGHVSNLEIDSDDVFSLLLETERCPVVSVHMNYLDSRLRRGMVILTDRGTVGADLRTGTVEVDGFEIPMTVDYDSTYAAMHAAAMAGEKGILCSWGEGLDVLRLIEAAELAAVGGGWQEKPSGRRPNPPGAEAPDPTLSSGDRGTPRARR